MDCHTQSSSLAVGHKKLDRLVTMDSQQFISQQQTEQKEFPLMIPPGDLCHIMSQHCSRYVGLSQCYLLLLFELRQSWAFLSNVTGNVDQ